MRILLVIPALILLFGCAMPKRGLLGEITTSVVSDTAIVTTTAEGRESASGVEVRGTAGPVETHRYGMSPELAAQMPLIAKLIGSIAAFVMGFMMVLLFLDSPVRDMRWRIICIAGSLLIAFGLPLILWLSL